MVHPAIADPAAETPAETPPDTPPVWVRAPKQERARRSFERVLDAAAQVLAQHGFEGFSIAEVCRLAAVSPGALYGRVAGKDELFLAVHHRELARMSARAAELFADSPRWRARSTHDLTLEVFRALNAHYVEHAALLQAFILRAAVDDRVLAQGSRANQALERSVVGLLLTRAADYPHREAATAAGVAFRLAADAVGWRIGFGAELTPGGMAGAGPDLAAWLDQVAQVCRTYLLTPEVR